MPNISQYTFSFDEVAAALLREQKIHEGLWQLALELNLSVGNIGTAKENVRPGAAVQVMSFALQRKEQKDAGEPFVYDAAKVNPKAA